MENYSSMHKSQASSQSSLLSETDLSFFDSNLSSPIDAIDASLSRNTASLLNPDISAFSSPGACAFSPSPTSSPCQFESLSISSLGCHPLLTPLHSNSERKSVRELIQVFNKMDKCIQEKASRLSVSEGAVIPSNHCRAVRLALGLLMSADDFDILGQIGRGFFSTVYKVQHKETGYIMVMKKLEKMVEANPAESKKEIEILRDLSHPNIISYIGACVNEARLHPLIEYVNGGTLDQLLQNTEITLTWCQRVQFSIDISSGIKYLHDKGWLHRDLNSHNCLVRKEDSSFQIIVSDFGLVSYVSPPKNKIIKSRSIVGTPYWMAPEVFAATVYNDKADVFSYGILLGEIISRQDANPEIDQGISRTSDFGVNIKQFKKNLILLGQESCPGEFLNLMDNCTKVDPRLRPCFTEILSILQSIVL